ncbi:hypothetical protein [Vulcanococcus sp.]|jgi:hypothetical protein|uniref:hypothetical protein n=1 Tax=Vulcanococcus sp. TaxID=2856995 RepID=UPI0037DA390B
MTPSDRRGRWVAIVTGAISVAIAVAYLLLITVLDSRGPLLPPPPEALGLSPAPPQAAAVAAAPASAAVAAVPPPG